MKLHVRVAGRGPDLVLLHGWGMCGNVWRAVSDGLEPHFRVHCVDLPGHGLSASFTFDHAVERLSAQLPPRATVCGWSLGAQLALRWAADMPQQVERLILVAATPCFVQRAGWEYGMEAAAFDDFARDVAADPRAALRRFAALQAHGDTAERTVVRELRRHCKQTPPQPAALAAGLHWLKTTDLRARLPAIGEPALVLHGERDPVAPVSAGAWLARSLPVARLSVFSGAAHAPFLSQPSRFVEQVFEFHHER
ncbi:MAG TPA: pimeloyl-ACP methyl ester esterase BioH [Burkholderiales bacterium]|nr:pimeloyl-ACP methyl ester esterase BioH [Burkholderiales bacterium]